VIGVNVLVALGALNFFGFFLGPVMRKVFKLPGQAGFALVMGLVSGYPIGSKIVSEMRGRNELTKNEAQRLLAFSNNGGPLFILGAVAAGMFGSVSMGYLLLLAHYLGAISVGLIMRLFASKKISQESSLLMLSKNNGPIGQVLGNAVKNAMETMVIIGGFMVLFSVISALLEQVGVFGIIPVPFLNKAHHTGFLTGLIEITAGVGALSIHGPTAAAAVITAGLISFGGLSITFQSLSFISKTDLSGSLYILHKAMQALFSGFYVLLLYPLFKTAIESPAAMQAFAATNRAAASIPKTLLTSTLHFAVTTIILALICLILLLRKNKTTNN
jgi:sporulation integral membrane protein YlbJ